MHFLSRVGGSVLLWRVHLIREDAACALWMSDQLNGRTVKDDFGRQWITVKQRGRGPESVRAGFLEREDIADSKGREPGCLGQDVGRQAQTAQHIRRGQWPRSGVENKGRACLAAQADTAKVRSLVSSAVDDDCGATLVCLAADDGCDVPSRLCHKVPAKFERQAGGPGSCDESIEFFTDGIEVQFLFARGIRDAKSAAEIEELRNDSEHLGSTQREINRAAQVAEDARGAEHLRAGEDMKPDHFETA